MHTIYKITNKITGLVYIGRTSRKLEIRLKEHIKYSIKNKQSYLYNSMRKYGSENFFIEPIEIVDVEIVCDKEREWILKENTIQPNGMNEHAGGRGGSLNASKELREKLSISKKKYYENNIHHMKNQKWTDEYRDNFEKNRRKPKKIKKEAYTRKNYIFYNENLNIIEESDSLYSFCKKYNLPMGNLCNVVNKKRGAKICKGWICLESSDAI